jgi:hypothetical protein
MVEALEPGREAYHRYGRVVGFRTWDGRRIPAFDELPALIQSAWVAAGTLPQNTISIDDAGASCADGQKQPSRYEN